MPTETAQHAIAPLVPLWLIVGLPLAGAIINLVFGSGLRWLSRGATHVVAVGSVFASFCVAFYTIFGIPQTPLLLVAPAAGILIYLAASVSKMSAPWRWALALAAALAAFVFVGVVQHWTEGSLAWMFRGTDARGLEEHGVGFTQTLYEWIHVDELKIDLAFRLDTLSAVMVMIVTGVGTLIHLYSCGYMAEEKRYTAYFGYLNLFTAAMLILVLAANMPVMFIGWEGVGLCSYLLIGFWFENNDYASAGKKAFVVNRIGDFAFLLGMFLLWYVVNQMPGANGAGAHAAPGLDFNDLRTSAATAMYSGNDVLFGSGERVSAVIGILLFIGACGKSAQIPLYVWLPDAMAGPTPVSALIHAATMVTAGVYMVCRLSFLFASSTMAMAVIATVGVATALMAAFYAFAQTDLKKVLAYSTVSQLGFMFAAAGTGHWVAAIFHLGTHAFFKAGLFLGAGSVMHGMNGSGDITRMGGLRKHMPWTRATFLVYCLAISGVPIFAGFFSKDDVLGSLWALGQWGHSPEGWPPLFANVLWIALLIAALGTAIYMWRLYFLVFSGEERSDDARHAHESPWTMVAPLVVLAILATLAGFIGLPHFVTGHVHWWPFHALSSWLEPAVDAVTEVPNSDSATEVLMVVATLVALLGIGIAYRLYGKGPSKELERWTAEGQPLHDAYLASKNKLWIDELYDLIIVRPFRAIARFLFEFVDRFLVDTVLVGGWAFVVGILSRISRWVQNGQVQRYIVGIVVGAAAIFFFAARGHHATFSYKKISADQVELRAEPGAGLASVGVTYRWDVDGDGEPDKKPGVTDKTPPADAFVDAPVLVRHPGELGSHVTLWIQPIGGGKGVEITRDIDFSQFEPASGSGSGSGSGSASGSSGSAAPAPAAPPPAAPAAPQPTEGGH